MFTTYHMKKTLLTAALSLVAVTMMAVPAKRGQWKTVTLADGTTVRVELRGDEFNHYWQAKDGTRYVENGDNWKVADAQALLSMKRAAMRRTAANRMRMSRRNQAQAFKGQKKGLIILVDFPDKQFANGHDKALYEKIANEKGYSENGFIGSVSDYFSAQSNGQFELTFDVVGPVRASKSYKYYGGSASDGNDEPVDELVKEVCQQINGQVNFSDYDWNGDGEVEQVFVLYAGQGQADGGGNNTIWPHEYSLSSYDGGSAITLGGVKIDTYACSCELNGSKGLDGLGTICHEFSHCLGLPDLYDVNYGGNFGMGDFSLLSAGNYLGNGMTPPNYTAWERWFSGWLEPIELSETDTTVTDMLSLSKNGNTYVIYNPANHNEYYLLENRQCTGWDVNLPSHGLMVSHVDYDPNIWNYNIVNACTEKGDVYEQAGVINDHQRLTIFHADNEAGSAYYSYSGKYITTSELHDLYPNGALDSLTNLSKPAATLYNANTDGTQYMNRGIYNITESSNGNISFDFKNLTSTSPDTTAKGEYLLHETFDQCNGTGGNSGGFNGTVADDVFTPDLDGWSSSKAYGADKCARFGNSSMPGTVTSPSFTAVADTMTLSFRAAGWDATKDGTALLMSINGKGKFVDSQSKEESLTMTKGAWTTYTLRFTGTGTLSISFEPSRRFFLDDVTVTRPVDTAVRVIQNNATKRHTGVYSLSGQYLGTSTQALPHGIYIVNGKKVVK